jgi:hypothetical protein
MESGEGSPSCVCLQCEEGFEVFKGRPFRLSQFLYASWNTFCSLKLFSFFFSSRVAQIPAASCQQLLLSQLSLFLSFTVDILKHRVFWKVYEKQDVVVCTSNCWSI